MSESSATPAAVAPRNFTLDQAQHIRRWYLVAFSSSLITITSIMIGGFVLMALATRTVAASSQEPWVSIGSWLLFAALVFAIIAAIAWANVADPAVRAAQDVIKSLAQERKAATPSASSEATAHSATA